MTNNKIKLSNKQIEVIGLMRNDWEMGVTDGLRSLKKRYWLQLGGIGKGGKVKRFHPATHQSLYSLGIIRTNGSKYPTYLYTLTELGKTIEL